MMAVRGIPTATTAAAIGSEASLSYSTGLTLADASRFLSQATMGPSMYDIDQLASKGYEKWLNEQFSMKQVLHREHVTAAMASMPLGSLGSEDQFFESFWKQTARGTDQLRQRVAFGLSQIFVVSFQDESLPSNGRSVASFYDVLGKHAFGNFRDLLQDVSTHPAMAIYLTFLRNKKESETRVPDENFARELMQLMTIGPYHLNQDGTIKQVNGKPVETYTHEDVAGLAKVFTGWSWSGPDKSDARFYGSVAHPNRDWKPLQNYPNFHSTSTKQVLGTSLPNGSAEEELDAALDRLFNHPNVGPFIGRQLIQRLVTSNPSPAYVSRVAAAFNNNGAGVRGDMKAVIRAILMDREARQVPTSQYAGRLREPVLRLSHWMRAFYASSTSGKYRMWHMDDALEGLAQTPMRAASVFNFYRPEYVPPQTDLADAGMVSPEMQITTESSVVGYLNVMQSIVQVGTGKNRDILPHYDRELELVGRPDALVERLNITMLHGQMSEALRQQLLEAINSINLLPPTANAVAADFQRKHRLYVAVFLTMASPEYLVQK
ncbi:DUF1800 domain-containing protein [Pseudoduganella lutea]|nr:DUF1800 domain-containing protein [Pseudoduganella lutea]